MFGRCACRCSGRSLHDARVSLVTDAAHPPSVLGATRLRAGGPSQIGRRADARLPQGGVHAATSTALSSFAMRRRLYAAPTKYRFVRVVRAGFAVEIDLRVLPSTCGRRLVLVALVLLLEALERCPRLDQRAVDGEVLVADKALTARACDDRVEEIRGHVVLQEPRSVQRKDRIRCTRTVLFIAVSTTQAARHDD